MSRTTTRSASDRILSVLKRGPKRGLTAVALSERAQLNLNTTRTTLYSLTRSDAPVAIIGRSEPTFGRPANLYAYAA